MLRSRRRTLLALQRCQSNNVRLSSTSSQRPLPPWGNTTLEALCRRDQSGEALRVVASLAVGVLHEAERGSRPAGVDTPPLMWHGLDAAAAVTSMGASEAPLPDASANRWNPERVRRCAAAVQSDLIGREREATLLLLAALAGEHVLIVGKAGVGKSLLAKRLARLLCGENSFSDNDLAATGIDKAAPRSKAAYFERQLSRFSTPEELLGPLSMSSLKVDEHTRCSAGHLTDPAIRVGFIDEIFRGSTAILNTLLELLASPVDHSAAASALARAQGQSRPCMIAASHPITPSEIGSDLAPLLDRFLLLVNMQPLPAERRRELLADHAETTGRVASHKLQRAATAALGPPELADLAERASRVVIPEEVVKLVLGLDQAINGTVAEAHEPERAGLGLADAVNVIISNGAAAKGLDVELTRSCTEEEHTADRLISDRRLVRATRLLRYAAAADGRVVVDKWDCLLLLYVLPPLDCANAATDAAVDYFRAAIAVVLSDCTCFTRA